LAKLTEDVIKKKQGP